MMAVAGGVNKVWRNADVAAMNRFTDALPVVMFASCADAVLKRMHLEVPLQKHNKRVSTR